MQRGIAEHHAGDKALAGRTDGIEDQRAEILGHLGRPAGQAFGLGGYLHVGGIGAELSDARPIRLPYPHPGRKLGASGRWDWFWAKDRQLGGVSRNLELEQPAARTGLCRCSDKAPGDFAAEVECGSTILAHRGDERRTPSDRPAEERLAPLTSNKAQRDDDCDECDGPTAAGEQHGDDGQPGGSRAGDEPQFSHRTLRYGLELDLVFKLCQLRRPDAGDLQELFHILEAAVLLAVGHDGQRGHLADALEFGELFGGGVIEAHAAAASAAARAAGVVAGGGGFTGCGRWSGAGGQNVELLAVGKPLRMVERHGLGAW